MKNYQNILLILTLAIVSLSCEEATKNKHKSIVTIDTTNGSSKEITSESGGYILKLEENKFENELLGIKISLQQDISLNQIKKHIKSPNQSLLCAFIIQTDNRVLYNYVDVINKSIRVSPNKNEYIHQVGKRKIEFHIPYYFFKPYTNLNLFKFVFHYQLIQFEQSKETNKNLRKIISIQALNEPPLQFTTKISVPELKNFKLSVNKFKLENKLNKINQYDFSMGGTGLPDLYWAVKLGDKIQYKSPVQRNATEFSIALETDWIYCTQKDIIKYVIADEDIGPFNTQDDIIAQWQGTFAEINQLKDCKNIRQKTTNWAIDFTIKK